MGILNVTPDSFSDGGQLQSGKGSGVFRVSIDKALRSTHAMIEAGASFIDIGGESTRPGAHTVGEQEELDRVLPVLEVLRKEFDVVLSVDTSTSSVISAAITAGAELINDVRALSRPGALEVLANTDVAVCLMHMRGQPHTMQRDVDYGNVVDDVRAYLLSRIAVCEEAGIARERLLIDPGFGFGKTPAHNFQLLAQLQAFVSLGLPIMVGVSRKSMLGAATGREVNQRLPAGIAATMVALMQGASIVRTHDVAATIDAVKIYRAVMGASTT
jgi:dihydropteroate synthase